MRTRSSAALATAEPSRPAKAPSRPARRIDWHRLRLWAALYLLIAPTIIGTVVFTYYPNIDVFVRSFYRWNDAEGIEEIIGWANFASLLRDARFWDSFQLAVILLIANLFKMWPGIFAAVVLHRLKSDQWRYFFQVLFVLPMVIPATIWVLMWKSFLDPNFGVINGALNATGGMRVLQGLDHSLWQVAAFFEPLNQFLDRFMGAQALFSLSQGAAETSGGLGIWAAIVFGFLICLFSGPVSIYREKGLGFALGLMAGAACCGWKLLYLAPFAFLIAQALQRAGQQRPSDLNLAARAGLYWMGGFFLLALLTQFWTSPTYAFDNNTPVWLGHTDLIIPTLILWGFPWIGTIGVLVYLSGLQQISHDIYEAGEIDGLTSWGKFRHIELPLILTQIRIMLILMTIGTLSDYGSILLLLGPDAGPGGKAMVPGLYMYNQAFQQGRFGYACAIGAFMFFLILGITALYQRYVKVEK